MTLNQPLLDEVPPIAEFPIISQNERNIVVVVENNQNDAEGVRSLGNKNNEPVRQTTVWNRMKGKIFEFKIDIHFFYKHGPEREDTTGKGSSRMEVSIMVIFSESI